MREPDGDLLSPEIQPTIIGAGAFHCPVRNGKEWGRSAMAVRQGLCFAGPEPCSAKLLGRNESFGLRSTHFASFLGETVAGLFSRTGSTVIGSSLTGN